MALSEKNRIFTTILKGAHNTTPFTARPHPDRPRERRSRWSENGVVYRGGTNMDYYYVFRIDDNNRLIKETLNREWHGDKDQSRDCLLCLDNGFNDYIDDLIEETTEAYNLAVGSFTASIERKQRLESQLSGMLERTTVKVISPMTLSDDVTETISDSVGFELVPGRFDYSRQDGLKLVEPFIKVVSRLPENIQRIRSIDYKVSAERLNAGDEPIVNVLIKSAVYDMLPSSFQAKDGNIHAILENGTLKVSNSTNNFINIESFTIYWGENVSTLKDIALSIPPQAVDSKRVSRQFDVYDAPHSWNPQDNPRYVKLENNRDVFPFGVAISYYNVDTNKRNTLFERKTYTRSNLN